MNTKLIITIVIILVIALVGWYLYATMSGQQGSTVKPNPSVTNITGDTTADISATLNEVPNDNSMNGEVDTLNKNVKGF